MGESLELGQRACVSGKQREVRKAGWDGGEDSSEEMQEDPTYFITLDNQVCPTYCVPGRVLNVSQIRTHPSS